MRSPHITNNLRVSQRRAQFGAHGPCIALVVCQEVAAREAVEAGGGNGTDQEFKERTQSSDDGGLLRGGSVVDGLQQQRAYESSAEYERAGWHDGQRRRAACES